MRLSRRNICLKMNMFEVSCRILGIFKFCCGDFFPVTNVCLLTWVRFFHTTMSFLPFWKHFWWQFFRALFVKVRQHVMAKNATVHLRTKIVVFVLFCFVLFCFVCCCCFFVLRKGWQLQKIERHEVIQTIRDSAVLAFTCPRHQCYCIFIVRKLETKGALQGQMRQTYAFLSA